MSSVAIFYFYIFVTTQKEKFICEINIIMMMMICQKLESVRPIQQNIIALSKLILLHKPV